MGGGTLDYFGEGGGGVYVCYKTGGGQINSIEVLFLKNRGVDRTVGKPFFSVVTTTFLVHS